MNAPAKKTAAKKTAAKQAEPRTRAMNVLPRLADGWEYHVQATGPNGESINVRPSAVTSDSFEVSVSTESGGKARTSSVGSLSGALQSLGRAAKALTDLAKKRAALAAAESDALGFLGDDGVAGSAGSTGD